MGKLLLVGDPLIRISPMDHQMLSSSCSAELFFGGSEVNIARTIGGFGGKVSLLTALPDNPVGQAFQRFLQHSFIDTSLIKWQGKRVGIYYLENGFGCRSSRVFYDRQQSSFTELKAENLEYSHIFEDVTHFHFSGISLALGETTRLLIKRLILEAKKRGVIVSFDLNYRSSMMSVIDAKHIFSEFAYYADVVFGMEPLMLTDSDIEMLDRSKLNREGIKQRLFGLSQKYNIGTIIHTVRSTDSIGNNEFKAYALVNDSLIESTQVKTAVFQRVGSGDAFVAGVLYRLMSKVVEEDDLDFGVAAASLKCTVAEDQLFTSIDKVQDVLDKNKDVKR